MELLFDDRDQNISGSGTPDLCLHRVLVQAQKALDTQMMKNNSICQQLLYSAAMVNGRSIVFLVRNTSIFPESGSLDRMRRKYSG